MALQCPQVHLPLRALVRAGLRGSSAYETRVHTATRYTLSTSTRTGIIGITGGHWRASRRGEWGVWEGLGGGMDRANAKLPPRPLVPTLNLLRTCSGGKLGDKLRLVGEEGSNLLLVINRYLLNLVLVSRD